MAASPDYMNDKLVIELEAPRKRGCRKGQVHAGSFKPNDPRRHLRGKNKDALKIIQLKAAEASEEALQFLVDKMSDTQAADKIRIECAKHVLDRAIGAPVSMSVHRELTGDNDRDATGGNAASRPHALTDAALRQLIADRLSSPRVNDTVYDDVEVIEVQAEPDSDD